MIHLLLWGNSYSQIIRDGMGRVVGLYPLLPNHMSVDRDEHGEIFYTYTPSSDSNPNLKGTQQVKLRRQDIVRKLLRSAEQLCMDVARLNADEFKACGAIAKTAVLYTVGYLYEHRDDANHKALTMTLRSLLMGIRRDGF